MALCPFLKGIPHDVTNTKGKKHNAQAALQSSLGVFGRAGGLKHLPEMSTNLRRVSRDTSKCVRPRQRTIAPCLTKSPATPV